MSKTLEPMILTNVRASFINQIFDKGTFTDGKPNSKFSVTLIFDKPEEHKPLLKLVKKSVDQLIESELKGEEPEDKYMVVKTDKNRTKKGNRPEYKGFVTIKAANASRPIAINKDKSPVTQEDGVFYSGCRVNVKVSFWANLGDYGATVGCNVIAVQFAGDDERLDEAGMSAAEAAEGFPEMEDDSDPFG